MDIIPSTNELPLTKEQWIERVSTPLTTPITIHAYGYATNYQTYLFELPKDLQNDSDIHLAAITHGKEKISNIPKIILNDKNFIINIIDYYTQKSLLLKDISSSLYVYVDKHVFYSPEVLKKYMENNKNNQINISDDIIEDKQCVLNILPYVNINELKEWYKSEKKLFYKLYKNDFDVQKLNILLYAPRELYNLKSKKPTWYKKLVNDKEYIIEYLNKVKFYSSESENSYLQRLLDDLSLEIKNDYQFIDIILKGNKNYVNKLSPELLNNIDFAKEAIEKYGCNIKDFGYNILENYDINKLYLTKNPHYFKSCPIQNAEFARMVMQYYQYDISILNNQLLNDKQLVLDFFEANPNNANAFFNIINGQNNTGTRIYNHHLTKDYDIMKFCIEHDSSLIKYSQVEDKENIKRLKLLAFNNSENIDLLPLEYFDTNARKEMILELLKNFKNVDRFIDNSVLYENYREDKDIIKCIVNQNYNYIKHFYIAQNDKEIIDIALNNGLNDISFIDPGLVSDKEYALKFVKKSASNLMKLPLNLRNDIDIAINVSIIDYSKFMKTNQLSNNINFHLKLFEINPNIYNIVIHSNSFIKDFALQYEATNAQELLSSIAFEKLEKNINKAISHNNNSISKRKI